MERDENKVHEILEVISDCPKSVAVVEDFDGYIDTEKAAEKVYDWIMENMSQRKAVEEFRDKLIDRVHSNGGYDLVIDAEDVDSVFNDLYPAEKPALPEFRVSYFSYREGLGGDYDEVVEAESVEEAIDKIRDRCYSNYSTCEIKSVVKLS